MLLLAIAAFVLPLSPNLATRVHAYPPYSLTPVPATTAEGNTVSLVLTDSSAVSNIQYRFRFFVTDPASRTVQSLMENYTTVPGQSSFSMTVVYPGPDIQGSYTLVGQYNAKVDELWPTAAPGVAGASFKLTLTDSSSYQRTQTVNVQAAGYNASETVTVTIKTQTTSTQVFSALLSASTAGVVGTSWKSPRNATIDTYIVTLTGTSTVKRPPDTQTFSLGPATMIINAIRTLKPIYQRTDTMQFSFQPTYPDGLVPSTGVGLLTLTRPSGGTVALTAVYNSNTQTFNASYTTSSTNQSGTWFVTLATRAYSDTYGNRGPGGNVSNFQQLDPAVLIINITTNATIATGQQLRLYATITYPDGTVVTSGTVTALLIYGGPPRVIDNIPVVYDTSSASWIGTYRVQPTDPGGLWVLAFGVIDSAPSPANPGYASQTITVQNTSGGGGPSSGGGSAGGAASFPLYYFGIIAALIAGVLGTVLFIFRKRGRKQTSLKIDLGAVQSEAGRIENTEFFKSVKDQVKKEKDET